MVLYLDDILVYSEGPSLHVTHVRNVLHKLQNNKLFVQLENALLTSFNWTIWATESTQKGYRYIHQSYRLSLHFLPPP